MTRMELLAGTDDRAIDALLDAAFGADRFGRTAYRIRIGMAWLTSLSFAVRDDDGTLAGLLQSWPVALDGGEEGAMPLVMVGPVAVLPERQGEGIGRALMDRLVETADSLATPPLVMIGDPEYYGRFWGFSDEETGGWAVPGPVERRRLLVRRRGGLPLPRAGTLGPRQPAATAPA